MGTVNSLALHAGPPQPLALGTGKTRPLPPEPALFADNPGQKPDKFMDI